MHSAGMVKLVNTPDLKSDDPKGSYGFEARSRHHLIRKRNMFKKKQPITDFRKPDPSSLMGRDMDVSFFFEFRNSIRDVAYGPVRDAFTVYDEAFNNDFYDAVYELSAASRETMNFVHLGYAYAYFKPPGEFAFSSDNRAYAIVGIMYFARQMDHPLAYTLRRIQERLDYENRPPVVPPLHPPHEVRRRSVKLPSRRRYVRSSQKIHQIHLSYSDRERERTDRSLL